MREKKERDEEKKTIEGQRKEKKHSLFFSLSQSFALGPFWWVSLELIEALPLPTAHARRFQRGREKEARKQRDRSKENVDAMDWNKNVNNSVVVFFYYFSPFALFLRRCSDAEGRLDDRDAQRDAQKSEFCCFFFFLPFSLFRQSRRKQKKNDFFSLPRHSSFFFFPLALCSIPTLFFLKKSKVNNYDGIRAADEPHV